MQGRVLAIAGSDSGGGAGAQADIKTVTALGGYAATALTAVTVQNSRGVFESRLLDPELVRRQAEAVLSDIGADVVKTGMLGSAEHVRVAADLVRVSGLPLVLDPVMVSKSGAPLLEAAALEALRADLLPLAALLTPNAPEAERLTGLPVRRAGDLRPAAERLLELGAAAVLLKGGHLEEERVHDLLLTGAAAVEFDSGRIATVHTHGTGCTLASACAVGLAQGLELEHAVRRARDYVREAILRAPGFGRGAGPLDHAFPMRGGPWS